MKTTLTLFTVLFGLGASAVLAQTVNFEMLHQAQIERPTFEPSNNGGERSTCSDTLWYTWEKNVRPGTVQGRGLLNATNNLRSASQWFDAPQAVTVKGFSWIRNPQDPSQTIQVRAEIFVAGPDSLPSGTALATQVISVTDQPLSIRTINFTTPVTVNGPYVLTITNLESATNKTLLVYTNYQNAQFPADSLSGRGENLSGVEVVTSAGTAWMKMKTLFALQSPPIVADVDFMFLPIVEYSNLTLTSTVPTQVICKNEEFSGTTVSPSPIIESRFYNIYKCRNLFYNEPDSTFRWTVAGSSTSYYGVSPTLVSATSGNIALSVEAKFGYGSLCTLPSSSSHTVQVDECLGLEENNLESLIKVFPNPSKGTFTVNTAGNQDVYVLNTLGSVIAEGRSTNDHTSLTFDLSNQPVGIYFVKIISENGSVTKKVNMIK